MIETPARLGIVDDHPTFRQALIDVVDQMPDAVVAWNAGGADEAMVHLKNDPVDLMVVDLSLPRVSGIELIRWIVASGRPIVTLVVSGHTERTYVQESFRAGAAAYVLKGRPSELRDGIRSAIGGQRYVSPRLQLDPTIDALS